jgi:glycosyltransferase involved in cell wall biosynthesis
MTAAPRAPRVVVGIPAHQSERFLPETLNAVAAQDWPALEFVCSDDASTDSTLAICRDFARRDRRVRVQRHARRVGWVANYNSLLAHATGDYFLWVPHDDLYEPGYVRELVGLLEARPDAVLAFSAALAIDARGHAVGAWRRAPALGAATPRLRRALAYLWWTEHEKFLPFRGVIRASALRRVGGLEAGPWGPFADDLWLFRMALAGGLEFDPRALCRKRLHPRSVSATERYPLETYRAYLGEYRAIVRSAGLAAREARVLLGAAAIREASVVARWPARTLRRRVGRHPVVNRLRWYLAQAPRRLARSIAPRAGTGPAAERPGVGPG